MNLKLKSKLGWKDVNWVKVQKRVFKNQMRIYKASLRNQTKKVLYLQNKVINSFDAKLLAVHKVTSENKGKRTPGVDKHVANTPEKKMAMVKNLRLDGKTPKTIRRICLSKPGKDAQKPLGIPILWDRAKQTLAVMVLEPQWEAKFEPNSYGFRPGKPLALKMPWRPFLQTYGFEPTKTENTCSMRTLPAAWTMLIMVTFLGNFKHYQESKGKFMLG